MTAQQQAPRPIDPVVDWDNAFFWEAAKRGELVSRTCDGCGHLEHPPVPMCPKCHGLSWSEVKLSGRGTVSGWLKVHHPPVPPWDYPLLLVTVTLEEGPVLAANLVDIEDVETIDDLPVEVVFAPTKGGWAVPLFRPRSG